MENIDKPVLKIPHSELVRDSEYSKFKSKCPKCEDGLLLVARVNGFGKLSEKDNCVGCGQKIIYTDIQNLRAYDALDRFATNYYILVGRETVNVDTVLAWAKWFEEAQRHVSETRIGRIYISTVFLGLDHSLFDKGCPLLFETMVFQGPMDSEMDRYSTYEEAEAGHKKMVKRVRAALKIKKDKN